MTPNINPSVQGLAPEFRQEHEHVDLHSLVGQRERASSVVTIKGAVCNPLL